MSIPSHKRKTPIGQGKRAISAIDMMLVAKADGSSVNCLSWSSRMEGWECLMRSMCCLVIQLIQEQGLLLMMKDVWMCT